MMDELIASGLNTRALHADGSQPSGFKREVMPSISVSTTFKQADDDLGEDDWDPLQPGQQHIYSRYSQPTLARAEAVLSDLIGKPTIVYSSGLAAAYSLFIHYQPSVVAITRGYPGVHTFLDIYKKTRGEGRFRTIGIDDEFPEGENVLCWLETPLNPLGTSRDIAHYAEKVHKVSGKLAIDSTFAPPPLQDPFRWGADAVMHSGTKYFGGHSDALAGTVSVKSEAEWKELWHLRTYMGNNPGSLEAWLLVRSLRTLNLRVRQQAETATKLAFWLDSLTRSPADGEAKDAPEGIVVKVDHAAIDKTKAHLYGKDKQLTAGPACFSIYLAGKEMATRFTTMLKYFTPATSLGGVESLCEQRVLVDPKEDPRLVRLSIGVEDFEDLQADLRRAFFALAKQ